MATRRFIAGTGVWNLAANWDDGAGGGGAVPLATDDVLFDAGSPACNIDVAAVALTINFTGYLAAITFTNNLTVSGNVTLEGSATYVAGAGSLIIAAASTITSDGVSLAVPLDLGGGGGTFAIALADNWTTTGGVSITGSSSASRTLSGSNLYVSGSFTISGITTGSVSGTATIVLNGTGTVTINNSGGFSLPLRIEAGAGVITFLSGTTSVFVGNTFTWVSGTVITTGHTLSLGYDNQTINSGDVHWNNVRIENVTKTLIITGTLFVDGILTLYTNTITRTISTGTISVSGGVTLPNLTTGIITGTGTLNMTGGILSMNALVTTGYLGLNTIIAGNVTLSGTINVGGGNDATGKGLTYASGTPVVAGSNFKVVNGAYTITCNAAGMVFGTLTLNAPVTFAGTYGFTCTEMISSIAEGAATAGDRIAGWNFTNWTYKSGTTETATTFTTTSAADYLFNEWGSALTTGKRYRAHIVGTTSVQSLNLRLADGAPNVYGTVLNGLGAFDATIDFTLSYTYLNQLGFIFSGNVGAVVSVTTFTLYEIPTITLASGEEYIVTDSLKLQGVSAAQPVVLQASTPATPAFIRCAVPVASQLVNNVDLTSYPAGVLTNQAIDASHGRKIYNANGVLGTLSKNFTLNSLWGHLVMTAAGQKVQITSASAGKIRIAQ